MYILLAAATAFELRTFEEAGGDIYNVLPLITGIGPTETAFSLTAALCRYAGQIRAVLNFGIAGAYPDSTAGLLDICLAEQEVLGDLGLCLPARIERFAERGLTVKDSFTLDDKLLATTAHFFHQADISCKKGTFVTVNCASGTKARARRLGRQFQALCENMEGAAAARVCDAFSLPLIELRCVSNIAGERDRKKWLLREACSRAGHAAALLLREGRLFSRF